MQPGSPSRSPRITRSTSTRWASSCCARFCLAVGDALARDGVIENRDDVFFLFKDEVRDALANGGDQRATVIERKASVEAAAQASPPGAIGTPPPPPSGDFVDPFMDAIVTRLLGIKPPAEGEVDPAVIDGVAGSPGIYRGVARVVKSLDEAGDLEDGEIMVCEMTLPPWVPMFSIAGAVVSDVGGVMSHCAIVAREFNIPAVVGTVDGTTRIKTGQTHHRRRHQGRRLPRRSRNARRRRRRRRTCVRRQMFFAASLPTAPSTAAGPTRSPLRSDADERLILLGTAGASNPKATRAGYSNAVVVGDVAYLVDCGEGVHRQRVAVGHLDASRTTTSAVAARFGRSSSRICTATTSSTTSTSCSASGRPSASMCSAPARRVCRSRRFRPIESCRCCSPMRRRPAFG